MHNRKNKRKNKKKNPSQSIWILSPTECEVRSLETIPCTNRTQSDSLRSLCVYYDVVFFFVRSALQSYHRSWSISVTENFYFFSYFRVHSALNEKRGKKKRRGDKEWQTRRQTKKKRTAENLFLPLSRKCPNVTYKNRVYMDDSMYVCVWKFSHKNERFTYESVLDEMNMHDFDPFLFLPSRLWTGVMTSELWIFFFDSSLPCEMAKKSNKNTE